MKSPSYVAALSASLVAMFAGSQHTAAQNRNPPNSRLVWAAKPVPPTAFEAPNRLIWRLPEILAAHKGQASWRQPVVKTRDFEADWISMAPGEKTKTVFYADDRVFWVVESGSMRVSIEGQQPFVATKGFLVQAAPRLAYSMETVGDEPVLRFEVRPAGEMPSYPITETPAPVKGWTFIKSRITDSGGYDKDNKPFLDFEKDVVQANAGSSNFVWDGHTSAHIIRGKGIPTPPPTSLGHFHENMVELWIILEGQLDFLIEGEPLVTGSVGDVVHAPNERWHRATFHGTGMATRLAITPRNKEGQVHYLQPDAQGDAQ
ncbi:MAG TPA: cupin domain-containing protein [Vicinamibacterales bacterium]|jgi:mannose-6-phosphate isomerase-like protein (cupin superfamily)|nr:cupin domain-containing protein [Vicinamibacterales bacterium]